MPLCTDLKKRIIRFCSGGPGSGRYAHCQRLASSHPGFAHVSMGDETRSEIMKGQKAEGKWRTVATLVQEGNMAPEDVTINILVNKLKEHADAKVILLDGYPRTREQVEDLNKYVSHHCASFPEKHRPVDFQIQK